VLADRPRVDPVDEGHAVSRIAVLDYGMGNLRSVERAIAHVGGNVGVTADPDRASSADALVIPGVGAFGACLRALRGAGLDRVVEAFARTGRPLVGVCLGMQVLFERSEEDPGAGLSLLRGSVRRLPPQVTVPHMGWNTVAWNGTVHPLIAGIPDGTRFFFVHSYAADVNRTTLGVTEHGRPFAAVVASGSLFATQFHPERSGDAGLQIYENLVKAVAPE
jgi:imidazole glycerol-phosphate synthase subunit HisH